MYVVVIPTVRINQKDLRQLVDRLVLLRVLTTAAVYT